MANGKMIQPTPNDVLSGRGASFNRHPGNENFRQMLEQHREVYSQSVKIRKVAITKSIVEVIYSKDPPGRFLRKCATTGEWEELSKKEAFNKAAQAMAYAVRDSEKRRLVPSQTFRSSAGKESEPTAHRETANKSTGPNLQLQRLLSSLQPSRTASLLPNQNPAHYSMQVASLNGLVQSLHREQQQQTHQQQQQSLLSLMGLRSLQPQTQHATALVPSSIPVIPNPSSSVQYERALLDEILRQASSSSLQGNHLTRLLQTAHLLSMQPMPNWQQDLLGLIRGIPQSQTEMSPRQQSVNQLQHRLDALLQNQLLSSLQQTSRPLNLLHQALPPSSQNLTNVHPLLSRMMTSSTGRSSSSTSPSSQGEGGEEKQGESD
ncbi:hypothetical protein ACHAWT_010558 [Skeletonema menzelii]